MSKELDLAYKEVDLIQSLFEKYHFKFDYYPTVIPTVRNLFNDAICGNINDGTLELKKLLEDSLKDEIDYLPTKYNCNIKELIGDENQILIDYYDH